MNHKVKISGIVITYNEESNIERCLTSLLPICDEIVVVDSFSTDNTKAICERFNVHFFQNEFEGHIEQKNFALAQASHDIVLSLDADEALSEELTRSILSIKNNFSAKAYRFNRSTNYCGKWIKYSGWYPDAKTRLWDRRIGKWGGINPHDSVELNIDSTPTLLKGDILHYSYNSVEEYVFRQFKYAKISAKSMHSKGKKASFTKLFLSPGYRFFRDYFMRFGFLDGFYGFIICKTSGYATFQKYAYLKRLNKGLPID